MDLLSAIFGPDQGRLHWWQISTRGVVIFLFCAILIRVLCRRAFGMQSYLDISLAVLLGSILSRAVTGDAPFTGTTLAALAIAICYWTLIQLAQRSHRFGWLVKGEPLVLVRDGRPDDGAMRYAGVSKADLEEAARQAQVEEMGKVQTAILERSGRISVLRRVETDEH